MLTSSYAIMSAIGASAAMTAVGVAGHWQHPADQAPQGERRKSSSATRCISSAVDCWP